ncbi:MAG: DUF2183 domain-containing protein [Deltaproteobacteria bacterium]|nr:DUF2183 domain-containing protein [Deltaproteobacteria bacterium]
MIASRRGHAWTRSLLRISSALALVCLAACGSSTEPAPEADDDALDVENDCGTCVGKADGWNAPVEESCEADSILKVANTASLEELDGAAKLNQKAANAIVQTRESKGAFATLVQLDAVPYVGATAFKALLAYAETLGYVAQCLPSRFELGLVSDLDLTVIPDHKKDFPEVAPYPGVGALYKLLELRNGGKPGDVFYVTARTPERVAQLPAWMEQYGVPAGHFETGTSGMPWIAEKEKVKDITAVMQARPDQKFVLFGDTSQRDPEVYKQIIAAFPGRVVAALVHEVTEDVPASRVEGLHLYAHYPEAAAILCGLGVIDEVEVGSVMDAARQEGMSLSTGDADALIAKHGCPPPPP